MTRHVRNFLHEFERTLQFDRIHVDFLVYVAAGVSHEVGSFFGMDPLFLKLSAESFPDLAKLEWLLGAISLARLCLTGLQRLIIDFRLTDESQTGFEILIEPVAKRHLAVSPSKFGKQKIVTQLIDCLYIQVKS